MMSQLNLAKVGVSFGAKTTTENPRAKEWNKTIKNLDRLFCQKDINFCYLNNEKFHSQTKTLDYTNIKSIITESVVSSPTIVWIPCMDERIQYLTTTSNSLSMGLPGCECLLTSQEKTNMAKEIVSTVQNNPTIEEIVVTSHDHCGAVQKAILETEKDTNILGKIISKLHKLDKHFCDKEAKKYSRSFAKNLIDELRYADLDVYVHNLHMAHDHLHCPNFHNSVGAIVNFVPSLNPAMMSQKLNLPLFNIHGSENNLSSVFENTKLAIQIAQSHHGFNSEFFTATNPFTLLIPFCKKTNISKSNAKNLIKSLNVESFSIPVIYSLIPV